MAILDPHAAPGKLALMVPSEAWKRRTVVSWVQWWLGAPQQGAQMGLVASHGGGGATVAGTETHAFRGGVLSLDGILERQEGGGYCQTQQEIPQRWERERVRETVGDRERDTQRQTTLGLQWPGNRVGPDMPACPNFAS